MSPEYKSWREVPKDKKEILEGYIDGFKFSTRHLRRFLSQGFAFTLNGKGVSKLVEDLSKLNRNQLKDAKKETSDWNLVIGFKETAEGNKTRKSLDKKYSGIDSENPPLSRLSKHEGKYRGKHRSANKGPGLRALLRSTRSINFRRKIR